MWRVIIGIGITWGLAAMAAPPADDLEEVVVTGSHLKGTATSASPLRVIDAAYLEEQGAAEIAWIILDLPYNMGSNVRSGLQGDFHRGFGNINLRGLGFNATLPLVNGRRVVYQHVDDFAPLIAVKRVETLLDGASALYGSDAVAGVVNVITRNNFEGFELRITSQIDDDSGDVDDTSVAAILGASFERGHFMAAYEWFRKDFLPLADRDLPNAGDSFFGKTYRLPQWNDPQALAALDPAVAAVYNGPGGFTQDWNCADDPGGLPNHSGVACGFNYAGFFPVQHEVDRRHFMLTADYALSETLRLRASYYNNRGFTDQLQSDFPWLSFTPIIPAHHPGLREDARRRGLDPDAHELAALQFLGRKVMGAPYRQVVNAESGTRFGGGRVVRSNDRLSLVLSGTATRGWSWEAAFTFGNLEVYREYSDTRRDNAQWALMGLGGPLCDRLDAVNVANASRGLANVGGSNCFFYNPFLNSQYTADGGVQTDPELVNDWQNIMQWLDADILDFREMPFWHYDFLASGEVFEIGGQPAALAVGAQLRWREEHQIFDNDSTDGNYAFSRAEQSFHRQRKVRALFAELALPVAEAVDLQLAVRGEDYVHEGLTSVDPKATLRWWLPADVNLRASYSTSFRAPEIAWQNPDEVSLAYQNIVDPANDNATFQVPVRSRGNADLKPQQARVWNIGVSWRPRGATLDVDYFSVHYTDLVIAQGAEQILAADPCSQPEPPTGAPCDPRVIRNQGFVTAIEPSYLNAGGARQRGFDLQASRTWSTDRLGQWRLDLRGVYYTRMDMDLYNAACDCLVAVDGLGRRNHDNPFGPIQKFKVDATVAWQFGPLRATLIWRHLDGYRNSGQGTATITAMLEAERDYRCVIDTARVTSGVDCPIDAFNTFDVQLGYRLPPLFGLTSPGTITLGAINLLDADPPAVAKDMGFDQQSHDARGRLWYARYRFSR